MEYMYAQTTPRFILSSDAVLNLASRLMVDIASRPALNLASSLMGNLDSRLVVNLA